MSNQNFNNYNNQNFGSSNPVNQNSVPSYGQYPNFGTTSNNQQNSTNYTKGEWTGSSNGQTTTNYTSSYVPSNYIQPNNATNNYPSSNFVQPNAATNNYPASNFVQPNNATNNYPASNFVQPNNAANNYPASNFVQPNIATNNYAASSFVQPNIATNNYPVSNFVQPTTNLRTNVSTNAFGTTYTQTSQTTYNSGLNQNYGTTQKTITVNAGGLNPYSTSTTGTFINPVRVGLSVGPIGFSTGVTYTKPNIITVSPVGLTAIKVIATCPLCAGAGYLRKAFGGFVACRCSYLVGGGSCPKCFGVGIKKNGKVCKCQKVAYLLRNM